MNTAQCSGLIETDLYYSVRSEKVNGKIQTDFDMQKMNEICSIANGPDDLSISGSLEHAVSLADEAAKNMISKVAEREWKTTAFFNPDWLNEIQLHQSGILPYQPIKNNPVWFEYLPNQADPSQSKYRCRLFSRYYDKFGLDNRYRPVLVDPILKASYESN
uniref:Uncharacterized protein n=1 Tax=Romanomermis culicivorax TaxID=13658 RepID=A0A915KXQ9_ROMCU